MEKGNITANHIYGPGNRMPPTHFKWSLTKVLFSSYSWTDNDTISLAFFLTQNCFQRLLCCITKYAQAFFDPFLYQCILDFLSISPPSNTYSNTTNLNCISVAVVQSPFSTVARRKAIKRKRTTRGVKEMEKKVERNSQRTISKDSCSEQERESINNIKLQQNASGCLLQPSMNECRRRCQRYVALCGFTRISFPFHIVSRNTNSGYKLKINKRKEILSQPQDNIREGLQHGERSDNNRKLGGATIRIYGKCGVWV